MRDVSKGGAFVTSLPGPAGLAEIEPFSVRSGGRHIMGLSRVAREISIQRDTAGVPHICAQSLDDALYGLGYMHATDRLTQILFARAVASGRAAETIAPRDELQETDRFFRRVGLHRNQAR